MMKYLLTQLKKNAWLLLFPLFTILFCAGWFIWQMSQLEPAAVPAAASESAVAALEEPAEEIAEETAPMQPIVVAVDGGHGGTDTGAPGTHFNESTVTHTTAAALMALLEADENYTPFLCSEADECPTPTERCARADAAGAQLLLSIHANGTVLEGEHGFEIYAAPPGRTYHEESLAFAHCVTAVLAEQPDVFLRGESGIFYNYYYEGSEYMATGYDRFFVEESDKTVYDNLVSYGMVDRPDCPAILIEQGYMMAAEDAMWHTADGCALAAYCYYEAICDYFGTIALEMP